MTNALLRPWQKDAIEPPTIPLKQEIAMAPQEAKSEIIITGGQRFDLSKSRILAQYEYGASIEDSAYLRERLYQSPKGAFFIVGDGGYKSKYAKEVGNMTIGTRGNVQIVKKREALKFIDKHADTKVVEEFFSDTITDV